jgi:hypothetical protein
MSRWVFVILSAALIALVGIAAIRDSQDRSYLDIQSRYQADYNDTGFDLQIQQIFPSFADAKRGDTFRVERCISCHVPDIGTIGPEIAAQRLAKDFMKYEPNAQAIIGQNHLTGVHPAYIANGPSVLSSTGKGFAPAMSYSVYGATGTGFLPYTVTGPATNASKGYQVDQTTVLPGPLPLSVEPATLDSGNTNPSTQKVGIDQVGCIICHNGSRLALSQTDAHLNVIINPEYDFTGGMSRCAGRGRQGTAAQQPGPPRVLQRGLLLPLHRVRVHRLRAPRQHHAQLGRHRQRLHLRSHSRQAEAGNAGHAHAEPDPHPHPVHPPLGGLHHSAVARWFQEMRRRTLARDLLGTLLMFIVLLGLCVVIVLAEHFLENFKSH